MVINFVSTSGESRVYHSHPKTWEFHQILDGRGFFLHGDKQISLKPGMFVISPPDYTHGFSLPSDGHISFYYVQFPHKHFERLIQKTWLDSFFSPHYVNGGIANRYFFEDIIRRNASTEPLLKKTAEYLSLSYIYDRVYKVKGMKMDEAEPAIEGALKILQAHIARPISGRELSRKVGFAESYLIRLFKKNIGMPPMKYLTKIRIESAQYLLASSPLTVNVVAEQSGYRDEFHFSKAFKKFTGLPPSAYRESRHTV